MDVTPPRVLTIAATDSGGGAGIAPDLRTFAAWGVHGCLAVTAVTVQNSVGVTGVHAMPAQIVAAQIESVTTDMGLNAVKTGMLANTAIIVAVAAVCDRFGIGGAGPIPLVVDPVAASRHGVQLLTDEALDALRTQLIARATLITPNLDEVRLLVGLDVHNRADQYAAARRLHALGARAVLVKGGHLREDVDRCVDVLYDGNAFIELAGPRFATVHTHGAGDTLGAAIAAGLARGMSMVDAVKLAQQYIVSAVRHSYPLGAGHGPVSSLWTVGQWSNQLPG